MHMYKAIGFDYGGVLNNSKSALPGIARMLDVPEAELRTRYYQLNTLANIESMAYEDLWAKIAAEYGHTDKAQQIADHIHSVWDVRLNPDMISLIDDLRTRGYKIGLLSNNTREIGQRLKDEGLAEHFDSFIVSADIGFQKPSPEAFNALFQDLRVEAQQTIFIDDSQSSLRLADEIGYYPILFKNYELLKSELTHLGILE